CALKVEEDRCTGGGVILNKRSADKSGGHSAESEYLRGCCVRRAENHRIAAVDGTGDGLRTQDLQRQYVAIGVQGGKRDVLLAHWQVDTKRAFYRKGRRQAVREDGHASCAGYRCRIDAAGSRTQYWQPNAWQGACPVDRVAVLNACFQHKL